LRGALSRGALGARDEKVRSAFNAALELVGRDVFARWLTVDQDPGRVQLRTACSQALVRGRQWIRHTSSEAMRPLLETMHPRRFMRFLLFAGFPRKRRVTGPSQNWLIRNEGGFDFRAEGFVEWAQGFVEWAEASRTRSGASKSGRNASKTGSLRSEGCPRGHGCKVSGVEIDGMDAWTRLQSQWG
jgi:hypothetical protein